MDTGAIDQQPVTVLVVDDNKMDRELIRESIHSQTSLRIIEADSKAKFEQILNSGGFELVLCDYNILGYNGLQIQDAVRKRYPDIPVIIVTGTGSEEIAIDAMKREAADYVVKTTENIRRLPETISSVIKKSRLMQSRKTELEALRENENQLRLFVRYAPVAVAMLDGDLNYLVCSHRWIDDYAIDPPNVTGRNHFDIFPATDERWKSIYRACLGGRVESGLMDEFPRANGRVEWIRWEIRPWRTATNVVGGIIIFSEIVTETKLAQEKVQRFSAILEATTDFVGICDLEGRMMYVNRSGLEMVGFDKNIDVSTTHVGDYHPPDIARNILDVAIPAATRSGTWNGDSLFLHQDGRVIPMSQLIIAHKDTAGKTKFVSTVARDISGRIAAERRIRESEMKYRSLFEESKDVVFISTPSGRLIDINAAGVELFGYSSKEELLNVNIEHKLYVDARARDKFRRILERQGHIRDYELELYRKDGSKIAILESATVQKDDGGRIVAYRGIIHDVTDKQRLEQQLFHAKKMEAVGTLAGGIAHDFNNILHILQSYISLVLVKLDDDQAKDRLTKALAACDRASEMVKHILTFSRRSPQKHKRINVVATVQEAVELLRSSIPSSVEIIFDYDFDQAFILADPAQIHQVVVNICTNAYQAMRDSSGRIRLNLKVTAIAECPVAVRGQFDVDELVKLSIADNGPGIEPHLLERIFDPFFTTKDVGIGTGLGLAVSHGIIKDSGGQILVESDLGKGSLFAIYLPLVEAIGTQSEGVQPETASGLDVLRGNERILVIDDEEDILAITAEMLQHFGYEVTVEANPEIACEIYAKEADRFDLIITDHMMPKMTGTQVAAKIRSINKDAIIFLSTGYQEKIKFPVSANLYDRVLHKPFDAKDLLGQIKAVMGQRREPDRREAGED